LSQPGSSKEKEYKLGYHEAIRRAVRSIEALGIKQGDLDAYRESVDKRDAALVSPQAMLVQQQTISENQIKANRTPAYSRNGLIYYLEARDEGYVLYEKRQGQIVNIGTLSKTSRAGIYLFNSDGKSMLASFDDDNNLIIDTEDNEGKPSQNVFVKVKQE